MDPQVNVTGGTNGADLVKKQVELGKIFPEVTQQLANNPQIANVKSNAAQPRTPEQIIRESLMQGATPEQQKVLQSMSDDMLVGNIRQLLTQDTTGRNWAELGLATAFGAVFAGPAQQALQWLIAKMTGKDPSCNAPPASDPGSYGGSSLEEDKQKQQASPGSQKSTGTPLASASAYEGSYMRPLTPEEAAAVKAKFPELEIKDGEVTNPWVRQERPKPGPEVPSLMEQERARLAATPPHPNASEINRIFSPDGTVGNRLGSTINLLRGPITERGELRRNFFTAMSDEDFSKFSPEIALLPSNNLTNFPKLPAQGSNSSEAFLIYSQGLKGVQPGDEGPYPGAKVIKIGKELYLQSADKSARVPINVEAMDRKALSDFKTYTVQTRANLDAALKALDTEIATYEKKVVNCEPDAKETLEYLRSCRDYLNNVKEGAREVEKEIDDKLASLPSEAVVTPIHPELFQGVVGSMLGEMPAVQRALDSYMANPNEGNKKALLNALQGEAQRRLPSPEQVQQFMAKVTEAVTTGSKVALDTALALASALSLLLPGGRAQNP